MIDAEAATFRKVRDCHAKTCDSTDITATEAKCLSGRQGHDSEWPGVVFGSGT